MAHLLDGDYTMIVRRRENLRGKREVNTRSEWWSCRHAEAPPAGPRRAPHSTFSAREPLRIRRRQAMPAGNEIESNQAHEARVYQKSQSHDLRQFR
jgi:hypothetical protein